MEIKTPNLDKLADAATGTAELFNLSEDPHERHDLAASKPEKVAELRALYLGFAK